MIESREVEREPVAVRLAVASDASGISDCFRQAYHGTYPISRVADSTLLSRALVDRTLVFAVAETASVVVGAAAMIPPTAGTCGHICHGAVLPAYRKLDLFTRLQLPLFDLARDQGVRVLLGRCVTAHPYSQRCMQRLGLVPVGLTLAAAPLNLHFTAIKERLNQRESFLDVAHFVTRRSSAQRIYAPSCYGRFLKRLYAEIDLPAEIRSTLRASSSSRFDVLVDEELGTATLEFGGQGEHALDDLQDVIESFGALGHAAIYAELPLASEDGVAAVETLRGAGFSLAAVLPERAPCGSDVLRLQKILVDVQSDPVVVDFVGGAAIKSAVFSDLKSAVQPAAAGRQANGRPW